MEQQHYEAAQFDKLNLPGLQASFKIFEDCTFTNCDFSETNFANTRFTDCTFRNCNLSNTDLKNATLNTVSFTDCKLLGLDFSVADAFLFSVDFESCLLDFSSFYYRKMPKTRFINCSLKKVNFENTNLEKSIFDNCNLEQAVFNRTNLKEADLASAYNFDIDPEQNNLKKASISALSLSGLLVKHQLRIR